MTDSPTASRPEPRGVLARIGAFELDVVAAELRRSGRLVALTGQPMRVLILLVARAGDIVTREELQREIWGHDTHVDFEAGTSTCINQIRAALGDRAVAPRFIETLPRRGYRFVARVDWAARPTPRATPVRRASAAVAAMSALAVSIWSVASAPARPKVPVAMVFDVDPERTDLQPVARALRDALIGALATEAGDRARVLSALATQELAETPCDLLQRRGVDYVVLVSLYSLGGPALVHLKLVGPGGWVRWTTDRVMTLEELGRGPLQLADEFSKPLVQRVLLDRAGS